MQRFQALRPNLNEKTLRPFTPVLVAMRFARRLNDDALRNAIKTAPIQYLRE
jgi:hypothetical protein